MSAYAGLDRGTTVLPGGDIGGWTRTIPGAVWQPDADLLWTPPGTKSGPDIAGRVSSVTPTANGAEAWVRVQLDKRAKYLDVIRQKVMAGLYELTPLLAKELGIDFEEWQWGRVQSAKSDVYQRVLTRLRAAGELTIGAVALKSIGEPQPEPEPPPSMLLTPRRKHWVY